MLLNSINIYVVLLNSHQITNIAVKSNALLKCIHLKVAPYSFLTAHELVTKSHDGATFKKAMPMPKSRAA